MDFKLELLNDGIHIFVSWNNTKEPYNVIYLNCRNKKGTGILEENRGEILLFNENFSKTKKILASKLRQHWSLRDLDWNLKYGCYEICLYEDEKLTKPILEPRRLVTCPFTIEFQLYKKKNAGDFSTLCCTSNYKISIDLWQLKFDMENSPIFHLPDMQLNKEKRYETTCPIYREAFSNLTLEFSPLIREFVKFIKTM